MIQQMDSDQFRVLHRELESIRGAAIRMADAMTRMAEAAERSADYQEEILRRIPAKEENDEKTKAKTRSR